MSPGQDTEHTPPSNDNSDGVSEDDLTKAEAPARVEQDAAVEAMKRLPQDTEAGSTEPPEVLNKDG